MGEIRGDAQQPGAQRAGGVEARQGAEGPDECLLGHIGGGIGIAQQQIGKAKDRLLVGADQRLPGRLIALPRVGDQV
jgi:hypothetical protein